MKGMTEKKQGRAGNRGGRVEKKKPKDLINSKSYPMVPLPPQVALSITKQYKNN
jgi:hypothetical protein